MRSCARSSRAAKGRRSITSTCVVAVSAWISEDDEFMAAAKIAASTSPITPTGSRVST